MGRATRVKRVGIWGHEDTEHTDDRRRAFVSAYRFLTLPQTAQKSPPAIPEKGDPTPGKVCSVELTPDLV